MPSSKPWLGLPRVVDDRSSESMALSSWGVVGSNRAFSKMFCTTYMLLSTWQSRWIIRDLNGKRKGMSQQLE